MTEQSVPDSHDEDAPSFRGSQATVAHFETLMHLPTPVGLLNGRANSDLSRWLEASPEEGVLDTLGRSNSRLKPEGASLPQVRRNLVKAWRLMLALQIDEALAAVERLELQLDDVSPTAARRFRGATQLLRATGLAIQDDSLGALAIAISYLKRTGSTQGDHAALTLCRFGLWHLGEFDSFHLLPRREPHGQWSKSRAISAMLDLSIEAAAALDHLRISTAKRLALDALNIARSAPKEFAGLAMIPTCIAAQLFYEEGCLDQADALLRGQLPVINANCSMECALRAYLVLARIAKQRKQSDFAALLLREAETLGERRGWPRLVAACLAERTSLLLQAGRAAEARLVLENFDRYAESHRAGSGHPTSEITRYRNLTRFRVSWAETRSRDAVAGLRQFYHQALERRDLYVGCRLAVELAEMLAVLEDSEEADTLFFYAIKSAAVAGLYQIFLEGGPVSRVLLRRAYARAAAPTSTDGDVLPFLGSLISQWDARHAGNTAAQPKRRVSDKLTARERDILAMISRGFPNKRIARDLQISPETVKSHVKRIFAKLAASTRTEAVARAGSLGLL